ncbi:hypothetical protein MN608_09682 [Microdochium nivale]|nr:hypothetical protein MN608_09682 [Microdochium nivale]
MPGLTPLRTAAARIASRTSSSRGAVFVSRPMSIHQRAALHQSSALRAYKDDQDRESLKPKVHEYSNDDAAAAHNDAAFDPNKTRPEEEGTQAQRGGGSSGAALHGSPTDQDSAEAGRGKAEDKVEKGHGKASKTHSPAKGGKVEV